MSAAFDIAILGGGPGGYATALRAANRGLRVAIVEADKVGGTCLHRGCIPSKALLHVGHLADQVSHATELGLAAAGPGLDIVAAGRFRDKIVDQLHRGLEGLLKKQRIEIIRGWGRVADVGEIVVGDDTITADNIVIATGSVAVDIPGIVVDGENIIRSDDALRLTRVPRSAVIVGGGAIGVEFASLWRSLGVDVTLVELAQRIVPLEDPDSSSTLARAFARRGITVRSSTSIVNAIATAQGVNVELSTGDAVVCDQLLIAVGRRPATQGLGELAELGVLDDRGFVRVDALGQTSVPGIWAVGDAVASLALAHAAFAEGFVVADAIAGLEPTPVDHSLIPRVTYSSPEIASVGLTEPEARERFDGVEVHISTFAGNARSLIEGVGGHVKLVTAADGRILGAHVVGPSATELIAEMGLAVSWEALADEVGAVVHAHPTLGENIRETALAAAGIPFHAHV
jgi:dihydrolipoamide dehydrogenase